MIIEYYFLIILHVIIIMDQHRSCYEYTVESRYNAYRYTAISVITRSAHRPRFFQVKFDLITKSACIC